MITTKLVLIGIVVYHLVNVVAMVLMDLGYQLIKWQCTLGG